MARHGHGDLDSTDGSGCTTVVRAPNMLLFPGNRSPHCREGGLEGGTRVPAETN